jgi:hypothetical protein
LFLVAPLFAGMSCCYAEEVSRSPFRLFRGFACCTAAALRYFLFLFFVFFYHAYLCRPQSNLVVDFLFPCWCCLAHFLYVRVRPLSSSVLSVITVWFLIFLFLPGQQPFLWSSENPRSVLKVPFWWWIHPWFQKRSQVIRSSPNPNGSGSCIGRLYELWWCP